VIVRVNATPQNNCFAIQKHVKRPQHINAAALKHGLGMHDHVVDEHLGHNSASLREQLLGSEPQFSAWRWYGE
jgi:hypothetical protein